MKGGNVLSNLKVNQSAYFIFACLIVKPWAI